MSGVLGVAYTLRYLIYVQHSRMLYKLLLGLLSISVAILKVTNTTLQYINRFEFLLFFTPSYTASPREPN